MTSFINLAGWQIYNPPFHLNETTCHGYWIRGDRARLQDGVDAYLNAGLPKNVRYHVLTGQVLASVVDIGRLSCVQPPQSQQGWLEEVDFAFFALVIRVEKTGPIWLPRKLVLLPLFLLVDNPLAVMGGREVFGYPKSQGNITLSPGSPKPLAITTYVLERFSPQTQLLLKEILHVTSTGGESMASGEWQDFDHYWHALLHHAVDGEQEILLTEIDTVVRWAEHLLPSEVTFVFRKQFPDASNPRQACYSAIVEAPLNVTAFRRGELVHGELQLHILKCDSLPIADFLGLSSPVSPIELAFRTEADFRVDLGEIIHRFV
jgi:hypothetical protein